MTSSLVPRSPEKGVGDYRESISAIEISFAAPVHLSGEHQQRLVELIGEICDEYERRHPDRVMWPFGTGQKMLTNPFMVDDDHPMQFDESVFEIECAERENYDYVAPNPGSDRGTS